MFARPIPPLLLMSTHYRIDRSDYYKLHPVGALYLQVLCLWIESKVDLGQKYLGERSYIVVDVYYVVRPTVVASVLNMCRLVIP